MITTVERPISLKRQVKAALLEVLTEHPALLREALEDVGLGRAVQEGLATPPVRRAAVFSRLRRKSP